MPARGIAPACYFVFDPGSMRSDDSTIFTGLEHRAELARQRFPQDNVLPLRSTAGPTADRGRKPPQNVQRAHWQAQNRLGRTQMKTTTARYACLDAREFPLQALLRLRPELQRKPVAVLDGEPPFEQVCWLNNAALTLGKVPGMTKLEMEMFSLPPLFCLVRARRRQQHAQSCWSVPGHFHREWKIRAVIVALPA